MCYSLLHHHMEKETLFKRDMYQKDIERTSLSKLTKLISWYNFSKSFSDASNSSDIEEKVMRQVNMLKQFDMEPKVIPKEPFVLEEENSSEEELTLTPQNW